MGTSTVRVDIPQMKSDGQKGGKLPDAARHRRSRGSRGRRTGRARVGKTRCLARAAARESAHKPVPKGTRETRLDRARLRRSKWLSTRFDFVLEPLREKAGSCDFGRVREAIEAVPPREQVRVRRLLWLRSKQLSDNLRRKHVPCGPWQRGSRVNTWGWSLKVWEMKYGTWLDVAWLRDGGDAPLGPLGRLSDGSHGYPEEVLQPPQKEDSEVEEPQEPVVVMPVRVTPRWLAAQARANARRGRGAPGPVRGDDGTILRGEQRRRELERIRSIGSPRRPT